MDHGHQLLIKYISKQEKLVDKTIIEIGSVREELEGQNSTKCFTDLCKLMKMNLISVDMDPQCSDNARKVFYENDFDRGQVYTQLGENFVRNLETFDYIYLDGYDYDHGKHSQKRNDRYVEELGTFINNDDCWESHLEMVKWLNKISTEESIICFDDIISEKVGKGVTAVPYLLQNGWYIIDKTNTALLLSKKPPALKEVYVVGNGKSLKDFDFEYLRDKEWIGCTVGFRHWDELGFYPKYYVNVDPVVTKYHLDKIKDMIINKKCEVFLLDARIINEWKEIQNYSSVVFIQQFKQQKQNPFRNLIDWCSGTSATCLAYCLDYDKINLLGMDCNYIEFLPECIQLKSGALKIIKTPVDNPNYYYPSYQRKGDIYQPPNKDRVHKESWFDMRNIFLLYNLLRQKNVSLINYNSNDTLDHLFERKSLDELN